jgi:uncharacterized membrane protein
MNKQTNIQFIIITVLILMLSGCGGGGADVVNTSTNTTMGQELMDLNESYKKGLLSEKEYNNAKSNIMDRYDN